MVGKEPEARASQQKELTLCILLKRKRRKQLRSWRAAQHNRKLALERACFWGKGQWKRDSALREKPPPQKKTPERLQKTAAKS